MIKTHSTSNTSSNGATQLASYLILSGTWIVIFIMLIAVTEGRLAPWDTTQFRPSIGTWERTLNDFFEGGVGGLFPALLIVGASILIYRNFYGKITANRDPFIWGFVFWNVLFIILVSNAIALVSNWNESFLPQPRPIMDVGYHKTWPAIAVTAGLSLLLLLTQWSTGLIMQSKNRGKT